MVVIHLMMFSSQVLGDDGEKKVPKQFVPILSYRVGTFSAAGSGLASGMIDFMQLRNLQGGVNGIMYEWEEYETGYNVERAVDYYEQFKSKKPAYVHPFSTGVAYALIEKATRDRIPVLSVGYGRTDCSDGRVFPYFFNIPTNYWSQSTGKIKFIAGKMGGMEKLKGLKIANLHLDLAFGKETETILDDMSRTYGFVVKHYSVAWPGIDQKAQWDDITTRFKADWVINRNFGISCTVPLKEAARHGFPIDRIIGFWWCGSEETVLPVESAAKGYYATNFHGVGKNFPLIRQIIDTVYGSMKGSISLTRVGTVFYNRGIIWAIISEEALRTAHKKFGVQVVTGEQMQWALEHLNITEERIDEIGAKGLLPAIKTTPADHEGGGWVRVQQWDGKEWVSVSGWISPLKDYVRKKVEASAETFAKEKKIILRSAE